MSYGYPERVNFALQSQARTVREHGTENGFAGRAISFWPTPGTSKYSRQ